MKNLLVLSLFFIVACSSSHKTEDEEAEQKAMEIINYVNDVHIQTFYDWIIGGRGTLDLYTRVYTDTNLGKNFTMWYYPKDRVIIVPFREIPAFSAEFPNIIDFQYVESFNEIQIFKSDKKNITVEIISKQDEILLSMSGTPSTVFINENPVALIDSLHSLKTKLGINAISHRKDLGNFFELDILPQYVLTYVPDSLVLNPKYKQRFEDDMQAGKYLNKNWNFRKLDEPFEYY